MLFISFIEPQSPAPYIGCVAVQKPLQILMWPKAPGPRRREKERVMTRVNANFVAESPINGKIVEFLSTIALVLAGILTMAAFGTI